MDKTGSNQWLQKPQVQFLVLTIKGNPNIRSLGKTKFIKITTKMLQIFCACLTQYCGKLAHKLLHSLCSSSFSMWCILQRLFGASRMLLPALLFYKWDTFRIITLNVIGGFIELFNLSHLLLKLYKAL